MKRKLILAAVALLMAGSAGLFAAKPSVEQQQQQLAARTPGHKQADTTISAITTGCALMAPSRTIP